MKLSNFTNLQKIGIYRIINIETGIFYIGSTNDFLRRYKEHLKNLTKGIHPNVYLQSSFLKHGPDKFEFEILENTEVNDLISREQFYLDKYAKEEIFNLSKIAGKVEHTEEVCKKISLANKGRPSSLKGKTRPEEVGEKISQAKRANPTVYSEESRQKMSDAYYRNKEQRDILLKQMHDKVRGTKQSEEQRQKSELAGLKAAFSHRKISDLEVVNFIKRAISEQAYTASHWAAEKGVNTSAVCNIFKRHRSKDNNFLAIYFPILVKIGYVDSGANSVTDLKKSEIQNKLNLDVEFKNSSGNLIDDPVELYNFLNTKD